ncbi:MAG: prephenate dehydrogenase/arogenate dehydrogenase family protein [Spirochaetia bacterium]|nr:prephenate dehydrogenase/arogenate dehydrogenase family protein [Spirochaetia bacterium]
MNQPGSFPFKSVLIHGMGMMGASLALAIRSVPGYGGRVTGTVRSEKSAALARIGRVADEVFVGSEKAFAAAAAGEYDLVVLGMPVRGVIAELNKFPRFSGVVTDMSSTREEVHNAAALRPDLRFVGSHPMCGSENAGPGAAKKDLYTGRLCIVTRAPGAAAVPEEDSVRAAWNAIGMKVHVMDAVSHDTVLAFLSHAPHVLSGLLALWAMSDPSVSGAIEGSPMPITGGGFRDMSRIAGSNPEMWTDIIATNREAILKALRAYRGNLDVAIERLESQGPDVWPQWFKEARLARNRLCGYSDDA